MKLDVFADERDTHGIMAGLDAVHHLLPAVQVTRGFWGERQLPHHDVRESRLFEHQRRLIQHRQGEILDHAVRLDVAEQRDLSQHRAVDGLVAAGDDDIRA